MQEVKSILEFDNGGIIDRLNYEMSKVMENISDPNTNEKPRELNIKIKLTPVNNRKAVNVEAFVTKKVSSTTSIQTQMQLTKLNTGEIAGIEMNGTADGQMDIMGNIQESKIIKLKIN